MSVVPWNQLDPAESPYVKLFGLVGIPFAGIINFVVLTVHLHVIVVSSLTVVHYSV